MVDRPRLAERLDVPDQDGGIRQRECEPGPRVRVIGRARQPLSVGGSSKHSRSWPVRARLTRVGACGPGRPTTCQYYQV